jgi:hypothetical protein
MNNRWSHPSSATGVGWLRFGLPFLAMLLCNNALGVVYQDIFIDDPCPNPLTNPKDKTYAAKANMSLDSLPTAEKTIKVDSPVMPTIPVTNVLWGVTSGCDDSNFPNLTCGTITIKLPNGVPSGLCEPTRPNCAAPNGSKATIGGTFTTKQGFTLRVTQVDDITRNKPACSASYDFHIATNGLGWGDPHITTVDGVHYDFQSAGEFTALRGDGLEIQTRQTAVATTFLPGANPYTGLPTCVAIYSAVAARVCDHLVSYQPNISGVPDPSGLQLRVDGVLTTLGPEGIDLRCGPIVKSPTRDAIATPLTGGRIVKSPVGDGIEIHYSDGTQLVVTPAWWPDQQKWYLNVNVYGTTATEGIFGKLAKDSWLPALPDGTSLGPKPESLHQRYVGLYEKFADAWRVTDATSLFDYAPGTSTATFTLGDWPRENPKSCAIPEQPSAEPVDVGVAEKHCSAIVDKNMKADCVFDVSVTGHTGFAQTYLLTQQLQPGVTETTVKDDKDPTKFGESVTFTATVVQKLSRGGGAPTGTVQFIVDGGKVGNPVTLDANGRASWSTSSLQAGQHQIVAKYTPSGWGGLFTASSSPEKSHTVIAAHDLYFWLIILLIIILLIVLIIWRYLRTT